MFLELLRPWDPMRAPEGPGGKRADLLSVVSQCMEAVPCLVQKLSKNVERGAGLEAVRPKFPKAWLAGLPSHMNIQPLGDHPNKKLAGDQPHDWPVFH
jgi:hypothetical protein